MSSLVLCVLLVGTFVVSGSVFPDISSLSASDFLNSEVSFSALGKQFTLSLADRSVKDLKLGSDTAAEVVLSEYIFKIGKVAQDPSSEVTLSIQGSIVSGVILSQSGYFNLKTNSAGLISLDIDPVVAIGDPDEVVLGPRISVEERNRRVISPPSSGKTACSVFIDIDKYFYAIHGGSGTEAEKVAATIAKAVNLFNTVAGIFSSNLGSAAVLELSGVFVHTTGDFNAPLGKTNNEFLSLYSKFLAEDAQSTTTYARGSSNPKSDEVCLNHALTHRNFGSVVGTAMVAMDGYIGGICSTQLYTDGTYVRAWNTGFSTSQGSTQSQGIVNWTDATIINVMAHEIGHNFGGLHECCNGACYPFNTNPSSTCQPQSCATPYIMYWMASSNPSQANYRKFSQCTKDAFASVMASNGACLTVPASNGSTTAATTTFKTSTTKTSTSTKTSTTKTSTSTKTSTTKTSTTKTSTSTKTTTKTSTSTKTTTTKTSTSTKTTTKTAVDTVAPSTPGNFKVCESTKSGTKYLINLSWTPSTDNVGVTGYIITRGTSVIKTLSASATNTTDSVQQNTVYTYKVEAKDAKNLKSVAATASVQPNGIGSDLC